MFKAVELTEAVQVGPDLAWLGPQRMRKFRRTRNREKDSGTRTQGKGAAVTSPGERPQKNLNSLAP